MNAPRLRINDVRLLERDVRLRMPFRFGVVTLTESPQVFAQRRPGEVRRAGGLGEVPVAALDQVLEIDALERGPNWGLDSLSGSAIS